MIVFREPHLTVFKASLNDDLDPDDPGGKPWNTFCKKLKGTDVKFGDFKPEDQSQKIKRSEIFDHLKKPNIKTPTICAAILAWGGMNMSYHEELFKKDKGKNKKWLNVVGKFRRNNITRSQAYEELRILHSEGHLKGLGPAFFTKLIYFLTKQNPKCISHGYIMDQWASCSINLLVGKQVVHLNCNITSPLKYNFTVSPLNTGCHYEEFCLAMDALVALKLTCTSEDIDRALLANGWPNPSSWRKYVIEHRTP